MSIASAKILIADPLNDKGAGILADSGLQTDTRPGLTEAELCEIIGQYDGLIVRSATKVTPKVIEAARKLKVIGRAGVGYDNIDTKAATKAGIIVENTPLGNITSAAEHALALLFSSVRNIPKADREMRAGKWNRKLTGVELTGKTLGIIGMGKVGFIVSKVARALDMDILVFDPYLTEKKAQELNVKKCELDALLAAADFVTIHTPKTPETTNLINKEKFKLMKKTARLINAARGGIVNEADMIEALQNGTIAGAALDVFDKEPLATDSPLLTLDNAVLTPHLGASTEEAQERVAEDIAKQFVEYFRDGVIRNAVNLVVTLNPKLANYAKLADQLGAMAGQMAKEPIAKLEVGVYGKLATEDTRELGWSALKGLLTRGNEVAVTMVNAPSIAEARGVELVQNKSEAARDYANLIVVTATTATMSHTLSGTWFEGQDSGRIVRIDDFDIDLKPAPVILLMFYPDRPGMVGKVGTILGEANVNIANMAVGRREKRGQAVIALTLDDVVTPDVLKKISAAITVDELCAIELA